MAFGGSKFSYGGDGRYVLLEVVPGGLMDPDKAGRVKCRVIGYDKNIQDEDAIWCRPMHSVGSAMDGGVGGPVVGATEKTIFMGMMTGPQAMTLTGTIGNSGQGEDGSDQTGTKADTNHLVREQDYRYEGSGSLASQGKWEEEKGITQYAAWEAPAPSGGRNSKDADEKSFTIGDHIYESGASSGGKGSGPEDNSGVPSV